MTITERISQISPFINTFTQRVIVLGWTHTQTHTHTKPTLKMESKFFFAECDSGPSCFLTVVKQILNIVVNMY